MPSFRLLGTDPNRWWIGLTDAEDKSIFRWLNKEPLSYEDWKMNEPDERSEQNCVMIHHTLKWINVTCNYGAPVRALCSTPGGNVVSCFH